MKLLVFRSQRTSDTPEPDEYSQEFDTVYADRVIGNLVNDKSFCTACGPDCIACRTPYGRRFGENIAGVVGFPSVMPYVLEKPKKKVPKSVPQHDILIAIHIHEQILIECLKCCCEWGTRGVIVPLEETGWVSGATQAEARRICEAQEVEIAFPKPFCSLNPPTGSLLAEFRKEFHIGYPDVELHVQDNRIVEAKVHVSAPCGATYYIARWLKGKSLDDDLKYEIVSKRLHSYPCTAGMDWDEDLDDTVLHVSGKAHYRILDQLGLAGPSDEPETVVSPLGKALPRPVPIAENVRNIEEAKAAILDRLVKNEAVPLKALRRMRRITPAALNTALLTLRREGSIVLRGGEVRLGAPSDE